MPIEAEDGGDGANRDSFVEKSGEKEENGGDERESGAELGGPMLVREDTREGNE